MIVLVVTAISVVSPIILIITIIIIIGIIIIAHGATSIERLEEGDLRDILSALLNDGRGTFTTQHCLLSIAQSELVLATSVTREELSMSETQLTDEAHENGLLTVVGATRILPIVAATLLLRLIVNRGSCAR